MAEAGDNDLEVSWEDLTDEQIEASTQALAPVHDDGAGGDTAGVSAGEAVMQEVDLSGARPDPLSSHGADLVYVPPPVDKAAGEGEVNTPVMLVNWTRIVERTIETYHYSPSYSEYSPVVRRLTRKIAESRAAVTAGAGGAAPANSEDKGAVRQAHITKSMFNDKALDDVQHAVIDAIWADFDNETDFLFANEECFHTTTSALRGTLLAAQQRYPGDSFGILKYQRNISDVETCESAWETVGRKSYWNCVAELKTHIGSCGRPLLWKMLMAMEVENLAIKQQFADPTGSMIPRMEKWSAEEKEEIELYATVLPRTAEELSVLDKIVAMVSERIPHLGIKTETQHYEALVATHVKLRKLWLEQFGDFPEDPCAPDEGGR